MTAVVTEIGRIPAGLKGDPSYRRNALLPIRDVPFSLEHLEEHARNLAAQHTEVPLRDSNILWRQFEFNSGALENAYQEIVAFVQANEEVALGAEWLLDNFYVVREQLAEIRDDLPKRFYRELPKLRSGAFAGYPRVYALAVEVIAHTDSALDEALLLRFLKAYQEVATLTMGELWAVPIMLRLGLVENLRRLAERIVDAQRHRACADTWTNEILEKPLGNAAALLAEKTALMADLPPPLIAHMVKRFRDQGHDLSGCWHWLEQRLTSTGLAIEELVRQEHQAQAFDQVSTGNAITSMRLITALNWTFFFEESSLVEHELRQDPARLYAQMDFATRDRYRHVIERLARKVDAAETEIARQTVRICRQADQNSLRRHVGYYLIDDGKDELEAAVGVRPTMGRRCTRFVNRNAATLYLAGIAALWLGGLAALLFGLGMNGVNAVSLSLLFPAAAALLGEIAVTIVNYAVTLAIAPKSLPKMDFQHGLPKTHRAVVVIPTLLTSSAGIRGMLERLEIHSLANPDQELAFALLTDYADAPHAVMPADEQYLAEVVAGIAELNAKYPFADRRRFFVFQRRRRWNAAQEVWMGWERKRGKLAEFNQLLLGATDSDYLYPAGLPPELVGINLVITLDSDTQLPLGAARHLIGIIAHPLNQPRLDATGARLERGYAILQPRIRINPLSARRSRFAEIYSGNPQLDPYVTAVSDVYQDCFREGSFTGKGIYDVAAYEATLGAAFPENQILSHDLIEGCLARSGLVTNTELIDDFPQRYHAYARRQHRWIRGDWQLLPWLMPWVPARDANRKNPLNLISYWKLFDNLRRSLLAPALLCWLFAAWFLIPRFAVPAMLLAGLVLLLPLLTQLSSLLLGRPRDLSWWSYARVIGREMRRGAAQFALALAFLPHQAVNSLDAIVRTLFRVYVSRRALLEWETASAAESRLTDDWRFFLREMGAAPFIAVTAAVGLAFAHNGLLAGAAPLLLFWLVSPGIALFVSRQGGVPQPALTVSERRELRRLARKTWMFFETFVGPDDHWLPPDNFQEFPKQEIAHRISPTNEGMLLTSAVAAHDFGYLGFQELATLLERNLENWLKIEHHRGHPYNWYDTQTLAILHPAYVSTVDSGNLAVSALTARQGIMELARTDLWGTRTVAGLADALVLVRESLDTLTAQGEVEREKIQTLQARVEEFESKSGVNLLEWSELLAEAEALAARCYALGTRVKSVPHGQPSAGQLTLTLLIRQFQQFRGDLTAYLPWIELLRQSPAAFNGDESHAQPGGSWLENWEALSALLHNSRALQEIVELPSRAADSLSALTAQLTSSARPAAQAAAWKAWLEECQSHLTVGAQAAQDLLLRYAALSERLQNLALRMDFSFLYDHARRLFAIGYNLDAAQLDRGRYDLLASESRLASFFAIGKGDVEYRHWFHLGRPLTFTAGESALLSWGGTMFEYLMPNLFLRSYPDTLLDQTCRAAVDRQIEFGAQQELPWGVSESAYYAFDGALIYQYQSFGVPGLGLKRGLASDLVIAPYAAGLALAFRPRASLRNFRALAAAGAEGRLGFYESLDYTPQRLAPGREKNVIRCYFAHHQGMLLAALNNCLFENLMQQRFHREPLTRATESLLQEKIPLTGTFVQPHGDEVTQSAPSQTAERLVSRWLSTPHTASPRTHLLSNGKYTVMITNAGTGYSECEGTRITRWRPDTICDQWGQFVYIRNLNNGKQWSAGYQPSRLMPDEYEVLFSVDKAEFRRRDEDLETHLEITVAPDQNVEVRLLTITNHGEWPRQLQITSYAEVVLGTAAADDAHPSFHKLFVQTEYIPDHHALLAWRRPRSAEEQPRWAMHVLAIDEDWQERRGAAIQFETDRAKFLGRGRDPHAPAACERAARLTGTVGAVLDPIFSLRAPLTVPPGKSVRLAISTGFAESREAALALADQYHDPRVALRAFELAWAKAQVELRQTNLSAGKIQLYQRLASLLFYPDSSKRAAVAVLTANRQGQTGLWRYGISGDFPILLTRISHANQADLLRELLLAHELWRNKGFLVELVVINEHPTSYVDSIQEQLNRLVGESSSWNRLNKRGGIFIIQASRIPEEDLTLLFSAAQVILHGDEGSLETQIEFSPSVEKLPAALRKSSRPPYNPWPPAKPELSAPQEQLRFANQWGGFHAAGKEYVIRLAEQQATPAPWSNVIANPQFGCLVTEAGLGCSWSQNSRENRLTSWSNDPVSDPPAEAIYLRDEETCEVWTPTPAPCRAGGEYEVRHGPGYTEFRHASHDLAQRLSVSVAAEEPLKFLRLKVKNLSPRPRKLSATYCVEWVLGVNRDQTQLHVITELEPISGALLACNRYNTEYAERIAFIQVNGRKRTVTGDRREFFGRNGSWQKPAALSRESMSGRVGAGLDPCGAIQTQFALAPGEETEIVFLLGQGSNREQVEALLARYDSISAVTAAVQRGVDEWRDILDAVQVRTPCESFDILVNHWLLYQTLSCRIWGRTAFYQSGGAYGFRDQLQDVMALVYSRPQIAREHLLRAAARQFEAGDVQHWWHPPRGRGVRTRFSDDYLWLPLVTAHYLAVTGDTAVLAEEIPYLHSLPLEEYEQERYELPAVSELRETLYEHCRRAIAYGCRFGPHGLPLMGCGDWNDGMNLVGAGGKGESVWVGWFLVVVLERFAAVARLRGDEEFAGEYLAQAAALRQSVEDQAWDGEWYRRAYFDDGTPLGSAANDECQIDSLSQSWAVIAGADPQRARQALNSVRRFLIKPQDRLILLFTPPFDQTPLEPGYIKGYVPGVRENGGQYTHAAAWVVQAHALIGEGTAALEQYELLNPIRHTSDPAHAGDYRVEPYAVAADVYGLPPHVGRGGWTWYTGSSAWMYRVALENILGFQLRGDQLLLDPRIPADWPEYEIVYRHFSSTYRIRVENPQQVQAGVKFIVSDGIQQARPEIQLVNDGKTHEVHVIMG